eukprot:TRINITY_DN16654_c0_g1_i1.p4 TRINITY_DN16654_c0_g1~~TRINITY_DN16654_c0_g1_i1.p4  ORF type:complete len:105 (+),score=27.53 TRINITY_DN16654_c0_g1_i1:28-342(+)
MFLFVSRSVCLVRIPAVASSCSCYFWIRLCFFFFSSRRRHTRCREVSWARRCVQETVCEVSPELLLLKYYVKEKILEYPSAKPRAIKRLLNAKSAQHTGEGKSN